MAGGEEGVKLSDEAADADIDAALSAGEYLHGSLATRVGAPLPPGLATALAAQVGHTPLKCHQALEPQLCMDPPTAEHRDGARQSSCDTGVRRPSARCRRSWRRTLSIRSARACCC
jgi:hypothetical protein